LKVISLFIVFISGSLLLYATKDFPHWGDPASPASTHVSPHYLQHAMEETSVPNVVTAVLADYRGFDTMFETTVIFAAGVACFILLRVFTKDYGTLFYRHIDTGVTFRIKGEGEISPDSEAFERIDSLWTPYDMIIKTMCRILIPFIQLFALYVIAHGHHSPGGGFQGGVILGASIILMAISTDLRTALNRFSEKRGSLIAAAGVLIFAGVGAVCLIFGANFLDYRGLDGILPGTDIDARSLGILFVEIGVGIAVMAVMILIYNNIVSAGRHHEGL
jgi:multicomponent Na+:H+ antiporter subunit B